jgi:hypothetical protein
MVCCLLVAAASQQQLETMPFEIRRAIGWVQKFREDCKAAVQLQICPGVPECQPIDHKHLSAQMRTDMPDKSHSHQ